MTLSSLNHGPSAVPRRRHGNAAKPSTGVVRNARERGADGALPSDNRYLRSTAWLPLPGSTPVNLMERTGCCWAIGEPSPQLFCNLPTAGGPLAYCTEHLKRYKTKETTE